MLHRLNVRWRALRRNVARRPRPLPDDAVPFSAEATLATVCAARNTLIAVAALGLGAWLLYEHPPLNRVERGEFGVRTNRLTGDVTLWREGRVWALPGLYGFRVVPVADPVCPAAGRVQRSPIECIDVRNAEDHAAPPRPGCTRQWAHGT